MQLANYCQVYQIVNYEKQSRSSVTEYIKLKSRNRSKAWCTVNYGQEYQFINFEKLIDRNWGFILHLFTIDYLIKRLISFRFWWNGLFSYFHLYNVNTRRYIKQTRIYSVNESMVKSHSFFCTEMWYVVQLFVLFIYSSVSKSVQTTILVTFRNVHNATYWSESCTEVQKAKLV